MENRIEKIKAICEVVSPHVEKIFGTTTFIEHCSYSGCFCRFIGNGGFSIKVEKVKDFCFTFFLNGDIICFGLLSEKIESHSEESITYWLGSIAKILEKKTWKEKEMR